MIEIHNFLNRFRNVKLMGQVKYQATCPCHNDKQASLTITYSSNKILLYCHAGCKTADILNAVKVKYEDLFNNTFSSENYTMQDFQKLANETIDLKQFEVNADETNIDTATNDNSLDKFHLFYESGKRKCVFDNAIFEYIINNYNLFVLNNIIYIYIYKWHIFARY